MKFSSSEWGSVIPNTGEVRQRRVEHARGRLAELADDRGQRPLLLTSSSAVAWATGGLTTPIDRVAPLDPLWVLVDHDRTTLIASSVEVERMEREYPLDELGFDIVAAPWYDEDAQAAVVHALVGDDVVSDLAGLGEPFGCSLVEARLALCAAEQEVLAGLAGVATTAVEGALAQWQPGRSTDRALAALVTASLEEAGADAVCLIVGADQRHVSFRHPMMVGSLAKDQVMVVVVARALGLHVALTRIAATEPMTSDDDMARCNAVLEHVMKATVPGATWGDAYRALAQGYLDVGAPDAWREHFQGGPIGYGQREFELSPVATNSPWWDRPIPAGCAVAFNPSLRGGAKVEDTYLVGATPSLQTTSPWPRFLGPWGAARIERMKEERES
jgi:antitoxin VapB